MTSTRHRLACSLLSLVGTAGLVAMSAPGKAETPVDAPHVSVSYADLDLSQANDRAVLDHRIRHAASEVCDTGTVQQLSEQMACRHDAIAQARNDAGLAHGDANN